MVTEVRVTSGFQLQNAKNIINVLGPELDADCLGNLQCAEARCRDAYFNALKAAGELGAKSIAIPGISAGEMNFSFNFYK